MRTWWLAGVGAIGWATLAQAGDPEAGRELAERWCTTCHVVAPEGPGADVGPALPELLRGERRTPEELRGWLVAPHPPMPHLDLTLQEIDDIVAYLEILSER